MDSVVLTDVFGNKLKANILFTHFDYQFQKDYVVYVVDHDILASSYTLVDDKYIINGDLSSKEYDMIDNLLALKLSEGGESYA